MYELFKNWLKDTLKLLGYELLELRLKLKVKKIKTGEIKEHEINLDREIF